MINTKEELKRYVESIAEKYNYTPYIYEHLSCEEVENLEEWPEWAEVEMVFEDVYSERGDT